MGAGCKQQLGRRHGSAGSEQLNLLQYDEGQRRYAGGVAKRVNGNREQGGGSEIEILPGHQTPNPAYFYRNDLPHLKETTASHATGFIHGDLNGRNIILDSRDNVWLIDFFHTHRGHVIRDLVKLENDILFIMTNVGNDAELAEAFRFTDLQLGHSDLGIVPDESLADSFVFPQFRKAWKTLCILRSYYRSLIGSDRDPYQFHVAYLRYAVHTLSFDECNLYQRKWALYASGHLTRRVSATIAASQRLRLDEVPLDEDSHRAATEPQKNPEMGKLYITILPGRKDRNRDLADDLEVIENLVSSVVCLVTPDELEYYGTSDLLQQYHSHNLDVLHFPILDQHAPSLESLERSLDWIDSRIKNGQNVLIHCVGGLGRSGLVAASYLMKGGLDLESAVESVRRARSERAIETHEQMDFLRRWSAIQHAPNEGAAVRGLLPKEERSGGAA